jgi:FkbM family methyltransferase
MPEKRPPARKIIRRILDSDAGRLQPVSVLWRFARWQLWRRALQRPMNFRTLTGPSLRLLPNASDSLSGFWYYGLPDFEELAFTMHLLGPGDLFVDVGANQGGWSLVAAGRGARVFAFEPVPLTRERLNANISGNSIDIRGRIRVFPFGLSDEAGQVCFTADLDAGNHRVREQSGAEANVIYVDLERADNVLRGEEPMVLKIDVEGEELRVLKGAQKTLSKPSLLAVVMETFRPQNFAAPSLVEAESILRDHDFAPMAYDPRGRRLHPLPKPSEGMQNTIYVRSLETVLSRIRKASPLLAFGGRI